MDFQNVITRTLHNHDPVSLLLYKYYRMREEDIPDNVFIDETGVCLIDEERAYLLDEEVE